MVGCRAPPINDGTKVLVRIVIARFRLVPSTTSLPFAARSRPLIVLIQPASLT
jgi:hypothetical protein